jgi:long-subunit acyl-CoA synthetase (AMP-forming)
VVGVGDAELDDPRFIRWDDLVTAGHDLPGDAVDACTAAVRPEDPATILYTSGTTGDPKGVVISHRNVVYECEAFGVPRVWEKIRSGVSGVLARPEQVKSFELLPVEWTAASEALTPTRKLKRRLVHAKYADVIDRLYG